MFLVPKMQNRYQFTGLLCTVLLFWIASTNVFADLAINIQVISADQAIDLPERSEADHLAERLLMQESSELVLDSNRLQRLSAEIQSALNLIRAYEPSMSSITAREHFRSDLLIVDLQSDLENKVKEVIEGKSGQVVFNTGFKEFDELNKKLGLFAIQHFTHVDIFLFYFANPLNIPIAVARYMEIDDVEFAEADINLVEWTDIDVCQVSGAWIFEFSPPTDEAFAGQNARKTFYFRVMDDKIERYWINKNGIPDEIPCPSATQQNVSVFSNVTI